MATIRTIALPIDGLAVLAADARAEGFRFIDRLVDEWASGTNRFAEEGACLCGAFEGVGLVGVCGLNRDPYVDDPSVGRLRHLYVRRTACGRGIGRALVGEVLGHAWGVFSLVRLRAPDGKAAAFYERLGFRRLDGRDASHGLAPGEWKGSLPTGNP